MSVSASVSASVSHKLLHRADLLLHLWGDKGAVAGTMLMRPAAGDKKSGSVRVLYDTTWSTRGVLQTVGRKPRGKNPV